MGASPGSKTSADTRRMRRVALILLCNPVSTVILALLLFRSLTAPGTSTNLGYHPDAPRLPSGGYDTAPAVVLRTREGLRVVDQGAGFDANRVVGYVYYAYRRRGTDAAAFAVTRESQGVSISGAMSDREFNEIHGLYVQYLAAHPDAFWKRIGAELGAGGAGGIVDSRLRPEFFLRLLLGALLLGSFGWAIWVAKYIDAKVKDGMLTPQEKRWRSLSRGQCPRCAYDIGGLKAYKCPECAETWQPMEMTAWERRKSNY